MVKLKTQENKMQLDQGVTQLDPKVQYIKDVMRKTNVSKIDFSRLTSISRETLHRWVKGCTIKDRLRFGIAYNTALRLDKACKNGRLPLTDKLKKEQRVAVLRKIIGETPTE